MASHQRVTSTLSAAGFRAVDRRQGVAGYNASRVSRGIVMVDLAGFGDQFQAEGAKVAQALTGAGLAVNTDALASRGYLLVA